MKLIALLPVFLAAVNAATIREDAAGDIPPIDTPSTDTTLTKIENPDVILEDGVLKWTEASWGISEGCKLDENEKALVCKLDQQWGGFGFKTENKYNKGTLSITMKVSKPEDYVQMQCQGRPVSPGYYNFAEGISMKDEYDTYNFTIPDFLKIDGAPFQYVVIQEGSNEKRGDNDYNTFYIKNIVYYPPVEDDTSAADPSGTDASGTQPSGTQPSGTQPSGTQPSGSPSTDQPSGSATPSGTKSTTTASSTPTTKSDDKDSGSTTVKVLLFNIAVVQIIMMMLLM